MEEIRTDLSHKPIVWIDYEKRDEGDGDAKILSIGKATWDNDSMGVKVWRKTSTGAWSRQSEDLPLWRVLDMAILLVATLKGREETVGGRITNDAEKKTLDSYLQGKMEILKWRLDELKTLLNM